MSQIIARHGSDAPRSLPNPIRLALLAAFLTITACGGGGGGSTSTGAPTPTGGGGTGEAPTAPQPPPTAVIDVLAVIAHGADALYADPAGRVRHLVNVSNDILSSAGTRIELRLTHVARAAYPDGIGATDALDDLTFGSHESLAPIAALRNATGADMTVLFRPYANDGYCGFAWVGGQNTMGNFANPSEADYAYSVVSLNCSDYVLLHELGHNMGLVHSRRENPAGGSYPHGAGYGVDGVFTTVMATPSAFNAPQLPVLSSASRTCIGYPCGVVHTDAVNGSEAARALEHVGAQIAAYR